MLHRPTMPVYMNDKPELVAIQTVLQMRVRVRVRKE
jgi:hypothetical protein